MDNLSKDHEGSDNEDLKGNNTHKKGVWTNIKKKLHKFFKKRPTKQSLYEAKIIPPEEDPIIIVSLKLPIFLTICKEIINSISEEGLFRHSGSSDKIKKLWTSFVFKVVSLEEENIHDICGAFKKYLRESPEPLIPFLSYTDFMKTCRIEVEEERIERTIEIIDKFPVERKKMLTAMMYLWTQISNNSEENKMTVKNIGIVFGPTIMRPQSEGLSIENALAYAVDTKDRSQIIEFLIENHEKIFPNLEEDYKSYIIEKEEEGPTLQRTVTFVDNNENVSHEQSHFHNNTSIDTNNTNTSEQLSNTNLIHNHTDNTNTIPCNSNNSFSITSKTNTNSTSLNSFNLSGLHSLKEERSNTINTSRPSQSKITEIQKIRNPTISEFKSNNMLDALISPRKNLPTNKPPPPPKPKNPPPPLPSKLNIQVTQLKGSNDVSPLHSPKGSDVPIVPKIHLNLDNNNNTKFSDDSDEDDSPRDPLPPDPPSLNSPKKVFPQESDKLPVPRSNTNIKAVSTSSISELQRSNEFVFNPENLSMHIEEDEEDEDGDNPRMNEKLSRSYTTTSVLNSSKPPSKPLPILPFKDVGEEVSEEVPHKRHSKKKLVKKPIKKPKKIKKSRNVDDHHEEEQPTHVRRHSSNSIDKNQQNQDLKYYSIISKLSSPNVSLTEKKMDCMNFMNMLSEDTAFKSFLLTSLKQEDLLDLIVSMTGFIVQDNK